MNVSDGRRGDADGRKSALANMIKLLHLVQDGCISHEVERGLIDVDPSWLREGEEIARRLAGRPEERARRLLQEVFPRPWLREGIRAGTIISSALMRVFLDAVEWEKLREKLRENQKEKQKKQS